MYPAKPTSSEAAIEKITAAGGQIRMADALRAGISRRTLYTLRDQGVIEPLSRGIYRLSSLPPLSSPDLIAISQRAPGTVICLVSALSFHGITTQIPHAVDIAILKGTTIPRIDFPRIRVHRLGEPYFSTGIEVQEIDGFTVRMYSPEKSIVDCFKFRNQIGMDVALEALKLYRSRMKVNVTTLMNYARLGRVEKIIRPYFEAIL